jgi:chitodextrinase
VTFDFTLGSGTDTNVAGLGGDLLASVGSGSYTGTVADVTPPVISSISSSGITQSGATISWTTNEASDTQVEYGLTTAYGSLTALNSSLVTSHSATLSGLLPVTLYHYRVRSRDAAGNLAVSSDNVLTTLDSTAPSAPGTPSLTVISSAQINLSWTASTDNVGVTGYRVERCSGSATCTNYAQVAAPTLNSYSDTGLLASTIYRYRVRAVDAAGNLSSYSSAANATTQPPPDTTAPTISAVTVASITTSGATITWTTNEPADTQVDYGPTASYGSQTTLNTSLLTSHSATLSGLSPAATYQFRVRSRDAAGNLGLSSNSQFTTASLPDTTAPSIPSGFSATPTSESQIQLSWTASTDSPGAGQTASGVSSYRIFRGGTQVGTTPTTAYLDTGLTPGTTYSYEIAAVDVAGNTSARSAAVSTTTPLLSISVQRRIIFVPEGAPSNSRVLTGTVKFINPLNSSEVHQASFTTNSAGQYTIDVPAGLPPTVVIRPVIIGYLSKTVSGVDLRNVVLLDIVVPTLPSGDFNGDGIINTLDFSHMNSKWGNVDALADINRDNSVNSLDFAFLSNNWLLMGE